MDKATFTNQGVIWNIGKRGKNTNLDGNLGVRSYCLSEKETHFRYNSLHFFLLILSVSLFEKVDILQFVTISAGTIENTLPVISWIYITYNQTLVGLLILLFF